MEKMNYSGKPWEPSEAHQAHDDETTVAVVGFFIPIFGFIVASVQAGVGRGAWKLTLVAAVVGLVAWVIVGGVVSNVIADGGDTR